MKVLDAHLKMCKDYIIFQKFFRVHKQNSLPLSLLEEKDVPSKCFSFSWVCHLYPLLVSCISAFKKATSFLVLYISRMVQMPHLGRPDKSQAAYGCCSGPTCCRFKCSGHSTQSTESQGQRGSRTFSSSSDEFIQSSE